ncbi:MAG: hypothetical protein ACYTEQ_24095 [Planctomycetota bacterium]|jgi:hypothetical protein
MENTEHIVDLLIEIRNTHRQAIKDAARSRRCIITLLVILLLALLPVWLSCWAAVLVRFF